MADADSSTAATYGFGHRKGRDAGRTARVGDLQALLGGLHAARPADGASGLRQDACGYGGGRSDWRDYELALALLADEVGRRADASGRGERARPYARLARRVT